MSAARHRLILLGLVCQGLAWDDWIMPSTYALLWLLALGGLSRWVRLGPTGEGVVLAVASAASFGLSALLGRDTHFFIGHGLAFLQLARLLRPLNRREQLFSLLIASFHFGVACTFVFDLRFILIFLAAVVLVPGTLQELAAEGFVPASAPFPAPRVSLGLLTAVLVLTVFFFLATPRLFVGPPLQVRMFGAAGEGSLRESIIDASRSGLAQSSRVLMQITGDRIGYLRCFSLVDTDGIRWQVAKTAPLKRFAARSREEMAALLHRQVQVKHAGYLERLIPTDGQVVQLLGNFFARPYQNVHGGVESSMMWDTANNVYEYWVEPNPRPEPLPPTLRTRYTNAPPASPRLRTWLAEVVGDEKEPFKQARRLESYLRDHFTYRLGAPELSRLNALEDFLFERKEGHCERFAAALATLMRLQGIPSRMVVGYVPQARNQLTGATVVRFKDAHSWAEGWFEGRGWVPLDATPPAREDNSWSWRALLDDLDFTWSSFVVNLDAPAQRQVLTWSWQAFLNTPIWLAQRPWAWGSLGVLGLLTWLYYYRRQHPGALAPPWRRSPQKTRRAAANAYERMLSIVAEAGYERQPHLTPQEFQDELHRAQCPGLEEITRITQLFCATRYGERSLTRAEEQLLQAALAQLPARLASSSPPHAP